MQQLTVRDRECLVLQAGILTLQHNTGQRLVFQTNNDVALPAHHLAGKSEDLWHGEFGDMAERKSAGCVL